MTEPHPRGMPPASVAAALPTHSITIPPSVSMVTLLGPRDELLDTVERAFPSVDVHVPVSYTHLDVYKRQSPSCASAGLPSLGVPR